MATTITNATCTTIVSESISLNNKSYGNTNTTAISSCNEAYERILHIPAAAADPAQCFVPVLTLTPEPDSTGDVSFAEFEYARFTNLDSEYPIWLKINNEVICSTNAGTGVAATQSYTIKLEAGKTFILPSSQFMATTGDIDCTTILSSGGGRETLPIPTNLTVHAIAHTTVCDLEMFCVTK